VSRAAIVTGASDGIGAAIVARLVDAGWFVVGVDVQRGWEDGADRTLVVGDVTAETTLDSALDAVPESHPLGVWVNNAAVAIPGRLHEATVDDYRRTMSVNLDAYFWGCQAAVRTFLASGYPGSIVNVSSIQASRAFPSWAAYAAAKGGVESLTRYIAVEYGSLGIRCNAVSPGNVDTGMAARVVTSASESDRMDDVMSTMAPLNRMAAPAEIAAAVEFLSIGGGSFVNGHVLVADGGASARCYPLPTFGSPAT
jgi:glucose 1-dehydrogenase